MFRRRRDRDETPNDDSDVGTDVSTGQQDSDTAPDAAEAGTDEGDDAAAVTRPKPERPNGPWDADEVDLEDQENRRGRLDLGALLLKGRAALQIRIDVDQQTRRVRSVTFMQEGSAMQLQAFAAPRSTGIWDDVLQEIAADSTRRGGVATKLPGPYGTELKVVIPAKTPDGKPATQASRIVGIDGPRWLLRASFLGAAIDPDLAGDLDAVLRDTIVVRGQDPMAPRDMLKLEVPAGPKVGIAGGAEGAATADRPPLSPFRRGPEITEIN